MNEANNNIVYFEFNNWFAGRDYPLGEPYEHWMSDDVLQFGDDDWCKENKLCVNEAVIDMSINYCITAPREWVMKNCPELLSDALYKYTLIRHSAGEDKEIIYTKKYSDFLRFPDENDEVYGRFGHEFLEYMPENFGIHFTYLEDDEEYDEIDD